MVSRQTKAQSCGRSAIDALTPEDDAFTFVGWGPHSGSAGSLRLGLETLTTIVYGDMDGDMVDDFAIELSGIVPLSHVDFIL